MDGQSKQDRDASLAVTGVSHRYSVKGASVESLRDVSLTLRSGDLGVLIGPSGCGKTTLLNLVSGFLKPTAGEVEINGAPVTGPSPKCTVVFQEHALFDWKTAAGNIWAGLHSAPMSKAEKGARVSELLELVNLSDFGGHYPAQLSGGMRQRVGLARALGPNPDLLVLDEPFAALDSLTREKLQDDLKEIRSRTSMTCLLVTHSIEEAIYLGDQIFVMTPSPGKIAERWSVRSDSWSSRTDEGFAAATRDLRILIEECQK